RLHLLDRGVHRLIGLELGGLGAGRVGFRRVAGAQAGVGQGPGRPPSLLRPLCAGEGEAAPPLPPVMFLYQAHAGAARVPQRGAAASACGETSIFSLRLPTSRSISKPWSETLALMGVAEQPAPPGL